MTDAVQAASVSGVRYALAGISVDAQASGRAVAFVIAALVWLAVMLVCARMHRVMRSRLRTHAYAPTRR